MNMEDLYEHMKAALRTFGLRFSEMDKVTVTVEDGDLQFDNGKMRITIKKGWK